MMRFCSEGWLYGPGRAACFKLPVYAGAWISLNLPPGECRLFTSETKISSHAEKQLRRTGSTPLQGNFEAQKVPADDKQQRVYSSQLNTFYDEVIDCIRDAEPILILGPGVAKDELKARLEEKNLGDRVSAVETVDKMTDSQIAAKVRQYFSP